MGSDTSSETGKRSSQSGARAARLGRELIEPPQLDLVGQDVVEQHALEVLDLVRALVGEEAPLGLELRHAAADRPHLDLAAQLRR